MAPFLQFRMGMETLPRYEQMTSITSLVEPWTLLPSQLAPETSRPPEQQLMLAVLREAVDEFRQAVLRPQTTTSRAMLELRQWFSSEDVQWPFSFRNLCEALDIDRGLLQARLGAWRRGTDPIQTPSGRVRLANRSMRGSRTRVG